MLTRSDEESPNSGDWEVYVPTATSEELEEAVAETEVEEERCQERSQLKKRKPTHWARDVTSYNIIGPIGEGTYGKVRPAAVCFAP